MYIKYKNAHHFTNPQVRKIFICYFLKFRSKEYFEKQKRTEIT